MSAKDKFAQQFDENRFKKGQREAALALVEYEFSADEERKTKQEISEELGICRKTLHNWQFNDPNFIAYKNYLASEVMDANLAMVYRKLLEGIEQGSMRGIEMFLKRIGDMDTKSEVTVNTGGDDKTQDERIRELRDRIDGTISIDGVSHIETDGNKEDKDDAD